MGGNYTRTFKWAGEDGWKERSACTPDHMDLFFAQADTGKLGVKSEIRRVARAKAVCSSCPVIAECLEHALTYPENHGVWGGLTEEERKVIRRKTQRTRTRRKPA